MANTRIANIWVTDTASAGGPPHTTGVLNIPGVRMMRAILRNGAAGNGDAQFANNDANQYIFIRLQHPTVNDTRIFNFEDNPIVFPNGISVFATNCLVAITFRLPAGA